MCFLGQYFVYFASSLSFFTGGTAELFHSQNFLCPPVFSCWLLESCRCWLWQDYLLWAHLCFRNRWRGKPAFCMPEWLTETRGGAWGLHHGYDTPLHSQGLIRKLLLAGKENDKHLEPVEAHRICSEIFSRVQFHSAQSRVRSCDGLPVRSIAFLSQSSVNEHQPGP